MSANIKMVNGRSEQLNNKFLSYIKKPITVNSLFILIFILLSAVMFAFSIENLDELWNYNFARCIASGMIPYKDFNMLQTPFSSYLSAAFLKIFGDTLISFRIASFVLFSATQITSYYLCLQITNNKAVTFTLASLIFALNSLCFYYNYNNLSLCLILVILLLKTSAKASIKSKMTEGMIFGLLPIIKQSTGLILLSVFFVECFCEIFIIKKEVKRNVICLVVSIIPIVAFVGLLLLTNNFKWFYEYAVLGVSTFTHRMNIFEFLFSDPLSFVFGIGTIAIILYLLFIIIKTKSFFKKRTMCFIVSLLWLFSVTYPIFDVAHYIVGIIPLLLIFFSFFDIKNIKKYESIILYLLSCGILILSCANTLPIGDEYKTSDLKNYKGIPINAQLEKDIKTVDSYIMDMSKKGKEVFIADATSAIYTIPMDRYKKHWDMLLVGNLGINTVADLLNDNSDAVFLLLKDDITINKQSHAELIRHIKENYKKIDEVLYFDVYAK